MSMVSTDSSINNTIVVPGRIEKMLHASDVQINGCRPWDIQVHDNHLFRRVLRYGSLGLGEAYMDGWWDAPELDQFLTRILTHRVEASLKPWNLTLLNWYSRFLNMQSFALSKRVAENHYDLSNEFYSKMLDPKWMQYTCAYYAKAENLDDAQEAKLDQICKKLQLQPGEKVLELGCGFGGFAKFAAERYGVSVSGYNISKEQVKWAREWTKDLPVEIHLADYRTATGTFDKVVSIGLCEHVGYKHYRTLMSVAHRSLKNHGLFLLHCIGGNVSAVCTDPWFEKYIFPGSVMPSAKQISNAFQGLFVMEDWHNFGIDYDRTCYDWFLNFDRNWDSFKDEYGERFYKMWKYYLMLCCAGFRSRKNQNWEVVLSKNGVAGGYRRN